MKNKSKSITKLIKVSKTGIKKGDIKFDSCPVARGMISAGLKDVSVDEDDIEFNYQGDGFSIKTPYKVSRFIKKFDNDSTWDERNPNRSVKPFNFKLKIPLKD